VRPPWAWWFVGCLLSCLPICAVASAQQEVATTLAASSEVFSSSVRGPVEELPQAPSATLQTQTQTHAQQPDIPDDERQTKRQAGILPNFRSVSPGEIVPPPTVRSRFVTTTEDNFDYSALAFALLIAADSEWSNNTPEFHKGMPGFARYYWHTVADQSIENYFVEFIVPTINHEDSRYYAMGKRGGGLVKRTEYSLSRVFVTRSDQGKPMFNYGEIVGAAGAVTVSTFYYPSPERTAANGARNYGLDISYDALTFMFHEFYPDISNALFNKKNKKN
jgi:hypothetical protein